MDNGALDSRTNPETREKETERLNELIDSLNKNELICMITFTVGMRLEKVLATGKWNDDMGMNERIKAVRLSLQLSQRQFGECLGVSRSVINNLERGVLRRPSTKLPLIELISIKFGIDKDWLLHGGDTLPPHVPGLSTMLDTLNQGTLEHVAVLCYWTLNPNERGALLNVFERVLRELNLSVQQEAARLTAEKED